MAYIQKRPDPYGSRSASIGAALGKGLTQLLGGMIQRKQRHSALSALGYDQEQAHALSGLGDKTLRTVLGRAKQQDSREKYERKVKGYMGWGMPREQAEQYANLPDSIAIATINAKGNLPGASGASGRKSAKIMAAVGKINLSRKIKDVLSEGKKLPENIKSLLGKKGYTKAAIRAMMAPKGLIKNIPEDIAQYFLTLGKGDANTARKIAKSYGFLGDEAERESELEYFREG